MRGLILVFSLLLYPLVSQCQTLEISQLFSLREGKIDEVSALLVKNNWHIKSEGSDTAMKTIYRSFVRKDDILTLQWYEIVDSGIPYITYTGFGNNDALYLRSLDWLNRKGYSKGKSYSTKKTEDVSEYTTDYNKKDGFVTDISCTDNAQGKHCGL